MPHNKDGGLADSPGIKYIHNDCIFVLIRETPDSQTDLIAQGGYKYFHFHQAGHDPIGITRQPSPLTSSRPMDSAEDVTASISILRKQEWARKNSKQRIS